MGSSAENKSMAKNLSGPDAPDSVGWTEAKTVRLFSPEQPFHLELGGSVCPVDVEYETYGELAVEKNNVVLIVHALSGDAHVAGYDKKAEETGRSWRVDRPGWWDSVVGPGKWIDTKRWFVVCANVLGSCVGTTGPSSTDPRTGKPYGLSFPIVTIHDWVRLQLVLLDHLGIQKVHAVVGGSLGGQQAIECALAYPDRFERSLVLAASPRLSTQGLAFNAVGRQCILTDPNFNNGDYYGGPPPASGLAAARMLGHITYLSDESMHSKFGRRRRSAEDLTFGFGTEFEVESYLEHQGRSFTERFDANSYLYITRAMDYYDAAQWGEGDLVKACSRVRSRVLVVAYDSDMLYPARECRRFAEAISCNGHPVTYVNIPSKFGHDAFLVETDQVGKLIEAFINNDEERELSEAAPIMPRWQDPVIESIIPEGSSVLDLGCGKGEMLSRLINNKRVKGQGIELDHNNVFSCIARDVPVFHADLDEGLSQFGNNSFEYVLLEETLQTVKHPVELLSEMLRIARFGIVSFPNFANYKVVYDLLSRGKMPIGERLPYQWYETPNIHLFTIRDFLEWASKNRVVIEKSFVLAEGKVREMSTEDNAYAEEALLVVRKDDESYMHEYNI